MAFTIHLATMASIYLAVAAVLRIIIVRAGVYLASGAAVFSLGAYVVAISLATGSNLGGLGFLAAPLAGGVWGVATAIAIRGMSPATVFTTTLLLQAVTYLTIYNWHEPSAPIGSLQNLTNGAQGISLIDATVFGARVADIAVPAGLAFGILVFLFAMRFERGTTALALDAYRIDPITATSLGVRGERLVIWVLALTHACLAILGALFASLIAYVDPTLASIQSGLFLFAIGLFGTFGRLLGPLAAVSLLVVMPEILRLFLVSEATTSTVRQGLAALAVLVALLAQRSRPKKAANVY